MKACVIQPHYPTKFSESDSAFCENLKHLEMCDESMDIIVLPEYSDAPALAKTRGEKLEAHEKYIGTLLETCANTAKRCHAIVFVNALSKTDTGFRNTTYAFNREGEIVGKYYKTHIPIGELVCDIESDYTRDFLEPYVLEIEGIRFAFLTCYDFYFYEAFAVIARQNVDVIIGCSHQRSDTHDALEIMSRFCAYNCNAYMLRSSISMDENAEICGASMIVTPEGKVLANMKSKVGLAIAEIDPHKKYYKPAGFGNPPAAHYEYIEDGRNPWNYRLGGAPVVRFDEYMPYPRVCAQGGYGKTVPANTLPAFALAISMDTEEIGFALCMSEDGQMQCNPKVEYKDAKPSTLENILKKFAGRAIFNIHLKECNKNMAIRMMDLIEKYDCCRHVYFTADKESIKTIKEIAPNVCCCLVGDIEDISWAKEHRCGKIQFSGKFTQEMADTMHENGLVCNVVAMHAGEALEYFKNGADTVITDDCVQVKKRMEGV